MIFVACYSKQEKMTSLQQNKNSHMSNLSQTINHSTKLAPKNLMQILSLWKRRPTNSNSIESYSLKVIYDLEKKNNKKFSPQKLLKEFRDQIFLRNTFFFSTRHISNFRWHVSNSSGLCILQKQRQEMGSEEKCLLKKKEIGFKAG